MTEEQNRPPRRDPLADLEARIEAAIEEVRPKMKKVFEELDARVDAAVEDIKPRVDNAMEDVRPRVDRFVADVQPRLDSVLQKIQTSIAGLRKDLEDRAARRSTEGDHPSLPRPGDTAAGGGGEADEAGVGSDAPTGDEATPRPGSGPGAG